MVTGIVGGLTVAFDGEEHRLLEDGVVVYEGDKIIHVGKSYPGRLDVRIDARKRLVIPGFIDIHSHISGCPFERGYRTDGSSRKLYNSDLPDRGPPFWESATPEDRRVAMRYSMAELLKGGVTTVVDMGSVEGVGAKESVELATSSGIRSYLLACYVSGKWYSSDGHRVQYENFDGETWDEKPGFKGLDEAIRFIKKYNGSSNGLVRSFLCPMQVDTCSPALFKETRKVADEHNLLIQTHVSQSVVEFREMLHRHGKTPLRFLASLGVLGNSLIAGHAMLIGGHSKTGYADPWNKDIRLLAETGTSIAHCVHAFARYGIALESYSKYLRMGVNIGLGLDTFPLDMIREMKLASLISKIVEGEASVASSMDLFNSATLRGAKALKRPDLGRIAPGAKADIVLINLDTFNMRPVVDPIKHLVHVATNTDVDTVIVEGKTVVEGGKVIGFDKEKIFDEIQKSMERIWERVPEFDRRGRTAKEINPPSLKKWK